MSGRTLHIFSAVIVLLAAVTLYALDSYGRNARVYGVAGRLDDPRVEKVVTATPQEAYQLWKKRRFKGRNVVFVGDKWERIDTTQYNEAPVYRQYPLKLYNLANKQEREYLAANNFLYFADQNGIARKITVVLSTTGFSQLVDQAPQAKNVKFSDGEIFMTHHGFPRTFTTGEYFHADREPALLYVSAAYFRENEPEELFRQLGRAGLTTDCVVLCTMAGDATVSAAERAKLERFTGLVSMKVWL